MNKSNRWVADIEHITQSFQSEFGQSSPEELNWKPHPKTWSVAQNIDHLITVNKTYFPTVTAIREGTYELPFTARFGFINRFFGNLILRTVSPDQRRKTKTLPLWEPEQSELPPDILTRFVNHQEELKLFFQACEDLLEKQIVISSPANKFITYHLEAAFDIIVAHEKRHLQQARATLALKKM